MKNLEFIPTNYLSDLTNKEWEIIEPFFPVGNKSAWHKRSLVNTVWTFFRRARDSGLGEKIMDALVKKVREKAERKPTPAYGIIDSQSAKTVAASEERGIDGGKKGKGS